MVGLENIIGTAFFFNLQVANEAKLIRYNVNKALVSTDYLNVTYMRSELKSIMPLVMNSFNYLIFDAFPNRQTNLKVRLVFYL
jgi:hypothetical protein